jgi:hypothetical protein
MSLLVVRQKVEDMIGYGLVVLRQLPKTERYVLGADLRAAMYRLLRLVVACNQRVYKRTVLTEIDIELSVLQSLVRIARDLQLVPFRQYENWSRMLVEIGRLVGGWIRSQRESTSAGEAPRRGAGGTIV